MKFENLTNMSRMDLLRSLGLAPRLSDYLLPAIGIFAAGAVVGAGTALLLSPKAGSKLRRQLRDEMRSKIGELEQLLDGDESERSKREREKQQQQQSEQERGAKKAA